MAEWLAGCLSLMWSTHLFCTRGSEAFSQHSHKSLPNLLVTAMAAMKAMKKAAMKAAPMKAMKKAMKKKAA